MAVRPRYLAEQVRRDLRRKMAFVAGPRQVGKTTLALSLPGARQGYRSWDVAEHRERILKREFPPARLWVFDEIHKYRRWRNYLKGIYDSRRSGQRILVTGSGRLELYRFGGDSLQGRYNLLRLHPFSAAELGLKKPAELRELLNLGGFPEPYLSGSEVEARRWSRRHRALLVRGLPELVGSPLSINALREDLQVSHKAVAGWIAALERLYAVFRLSPVGAPQIRAVK
jgi:predicted AAA+ superfamily ATPase